MTHSWKIFASNTVGKFVILGKHNGRNDENDFQDFSDRKYSLHVDFEWEQQLKHSYLLSNLDLVCVFFLFMFSREKWNKLTFTHVSFFILFFSVLDCIIARRLHWIQEFRAVSLLHRQAAVAI